jgi:mono/diheme cytochrome c family protein
MRAKSIFALAMAVVVLGAAGLAFYGWHREIPAVEARSATFSDGLVAKGAELARIGNCNTCHTAEGGAPYAGGRAMTTPFGTVYATNITPDRETGIGAWSDAAFARALQQGVRRDGAHLYPAFPYDHFTKLSVDDVSAIYAFLMTREPVRAETPANDLTFPFNIRALIAGWKLLFFTPGEFHHDAAQTAEQNRGAYLVEALAHCGACHTPRNLLGAEKRSQRFAGGEVEGWHAPALNAASPAPIPWTAEQLAEYLRHGFVEPHGVAAGPMQEVVNNLADVAEEDIDAMAAYVATMLEPATADRGAKSDELFARFDRMRPAPGAQARRETTASAAPAQRSDGAVIYAGACALCHEPNARQFSAQGIDLMYSKVVAMPDPRNLIHVVLNGIEPPAGTAAALMPGFAEAMTDSQVAALVTYMRATFSDQPPWRDVESRVRAARAPKGS